MTTAQSSSRIRFRYVLTTVWSALKVEVVADGGMDGQEALR
jgi:hypothetical protein